MSLSYILFPRLDSISPLVRSDRANTLLHSGFIIIAVCTALDSRALISLCFCYATDRRLLVELEAGLFSALITLAQSTITQA